MLKEMFCFQCEQTAGCTGCTGKAGVCGKTAASAGLQDQLTGELIGLARTAKGAAPTAETHHVMMAGMFATVTNVNFNDAAIKEQIEQVKKAGKTLAAKGGGGAYACDGPAPCGGCGEVRCFRYSAADVFQLRHRLS